VAVAEVLDDNHSPLVRCFRVMLFRSQQASGDFEVLASMMQAFELGGYQAGMSM